MMKGTPAKDVDQYLAELESDVARQTLRWIRGIVRDEIPEAKEVISYGMPMYMFYGMVISFAAYKKHFSLYPGHTVADFADQLTGYKLSKGTIQFQSDNPLPEALIRAMARARADENFQQHLLEGQ